ncbi:CBS domain-containing protein [Alloalcanivorax profundimaris]|uniref:CBS domain-containing protein n=1 Tax=Alloalcanivorax profundimaris TaxID=2735259 RepID=UPI001891D123|nr:CBS domain-containing protein [Alloalcanivorax profundimaris]
MLRANPVRDCMKPDPFTLSPSSTVSDAARALLTRNLSGAPVVDDGGTLIGMFSEADALKAALDADYHGTGSGRVVDYMSREVHGVPVAATVQEAAELFLRYHRRTLPVVQGPRLVGLLSRGDVLRQVTPARATSP